MVKKEQVENEKICAILSYLFIGVIWYFADEKMKKSSFARFHAKQGLVLFIADVIAWAIGSVPIIGWLIGWILYVGVIILMVIGIINAANDQEKPLPIIGKYGEKFSF